MARRRKRIVDDDTLKLQLRRLRKLYPGATCALVHRNAWELLVATILSAQCSDKLVNEVTPGVFARWPGPRELADAPPEELLAAIVRINFNRTKSKHLLETARIIVAEHGGEVPRDLPTLTKLPGVARKTANVVLGTAYGIPSGFVVDTHVERVSRRLGFVDAEGPVKIEQALMERVPKKAWIEVAHALILHGRQICDAKRPRCEVCPLAPDCPSAEVG
jgi:endonuclease III